MRAVGCGEEIAIGPMFELVPPGIFPVVEDLAAEYVPADTPRGCSFRPMQMTVSAHEIIEACDFESGVVEAWRIGRLNQKQRMVIGWHLTAIAAEKCSDGRSRRCFNFIGCQETEVSLIPFLGRSKVTYAEYRMPETNGAGGTV
jgi:hypothetical protein